MPRYKWYVSEVEIGRGPAARAYIVLAASWQEANSLAREYVPDLRVLRLTERIKGRVLRGTPTLERIA